MAGAYLICENRDNIPVYTPTLLSRDTNTKKTKHSQALLS